MYNNFALLYDKLMDDVDYKSWYLYIEKIFDKFNKKPNNILEMACGTGNLSHYLGAKGYRLTCFDVSSEMLSIAYNKLRGFKNISLLNQNMIDFNLNEKYDAVISICDSINYIINEEDLLRVFKNVRNHIKEDGIFIFDINSYYKLKHIIGNNTFVEDRKDVYYTWQNFFDDGEETVEFYLTFFALDKDKKYIRIDEEHIQKAYHKEKIIQLLRAASFKEIRYFDGFSFDKVDEKSERIHFVALG